jgi:hypothetical protein
MSLSLFIFFLEDVGVLLVSGVRLVPVDLSDSAVISGCSGDQTVSIVGHTDEHDDGLLSISVLISGLSSGFTIVLFG